MRKFSWQSVSLAAWMIAVVCFGIGFRQQQCRNMEYFGTCGSFQQIGVLSCCGGGLTHAASIVTPGSVHKCLDADVGRQRCDPCGATVTATKQDYCCVGTLCEVQPCGDPVVVQSCCSATLLGDACP